MKYPCVEVHAKLNKKGTSQNTGSEDGWGEKFPVHPQGLKSPPSAYAHVVPIAPISGGDAIKLKAYTENEPNAV